MDLIIMFSQYQGGLWRLGGFNHASQASDLPTEQNVKTDDDCVQNAELYFWSGAYVGYNVALAF